MPPKARKKRKFQNDGRGPGSNATLLRSKKKESANQGQPQKQGAVVGLQWGFGAMGKHFTNARNLDSFLVLFCAMWRSGPLARDFEELGDPNSLLPQAFALMEENNWDDAWVL